jgi:alpha-glucosidase (family GH31 glycosyl hydrolase)
MGGILDIYIFTGPTPIQAIEQFQQVRILFTNIPKSDWCSIFFYWKAFGLPKLPPYWSLGLQVGVENFRDSRHVRELIQTLKKSKLGFVSYKML